MADASRQLEKDGQRAKIMIDCSHANSGKDHNKQPEVCRNVAEQVSQGNTDIFGVMLESHLVAGRQDVAESQDLIYGQSITDACMGWDESEILLRELAIAVQQRRQ